MAVTDQNRVHPQYRIMCVFLVPEPTVVRRVVEGPRPSILFFLLTAVLVISGCKSKDQVQAAGASGRRPPAPVVVATVERRDIPVQIRAIGNVEPYQTVQIRSQVNGQIQKIFFKEGEDVREGQLLFQLDKRPFQADLEKAIGQMKHDQAQAENSRFKQSATPRWRKKALRPTNRPNSCVPRQRPMRPQWKQTRPRSRPPGFNCSTPTSLLPSTHALEH